MSKDTLNLSPALLAYLRDVSLREPACLAALRAETARMAEANMQISPEQGQFMALLVGLTGARTVLEIGSFTGYSALAMALALPPEGRVVACDISAEFTAIARRHWDAAGVGGKIALRLGPALESLADLAAEGARFDMAFIDADKENYDSYYEASLALLNPGGLVMVDNVLWGGGVADPADTSPSTSAIRALNARLRDDTRVDLSLLPIGDGLTLARKKP